MLPAAKPYARRILPVLVAVLVAVTSGACNRFASGNIADRCEPVAATLDASASWESLSGSFRLTLVATAGGDSGEAASGTLALEPTPPELRGVPGAGGGMIPGASSPLFGRAEIDLAAVGAAQVGSLSSRDPLRPGVVVVEQSGGPPTPPSITLRFGADANRRDVASIEGAYTALHVHLVTPDSFAGRWRSSGTGGVHSSGHFCAVSTAAVVP